MPLELTQSRVQKIWVPVDHRPSLPRCECRQLRGGLGCRLRRVQSPAIVCAAALCRFPSAGSALVLAGRRGGVAAGCVSQAGQKGRCGSGNLLCARPGLSSLGQRLPEAAPESPWPTAAGARPPSPTPPFLWVSSGSRSLFFLPRIFAPLYISIFAVTPVTADSWLQGWFMGW